MRKSISLGALAATTALYSIFAGGPVQAQEAAQETATVNQLGAAEELLGEVVVTATKQNDTVNRVPLSITAVTQTSLEQQGVKTAEDLARITPSLVITPGNSPNGSNISIRGVSSSIGASTTAVYLDDAPLQRRTTFGTFSGSGTPFPDLFDLERVEVLRGPQGTLYGGSAQGGLIRFITPTPSLTRYSASVRAELSSTKDGGANYEAGVAVGGPILADKLAVRLSTWGRYDEGYVDHVFMYTGQKLGENTNDQKRSALRAVLLWQPTERLRISPSYYLARDKRDDIDTWWSDISAFTVPTARYTATGAAATGTAPAAYTLPGFTYGPYDVFGPYKTGINCNIGANFVGAIPACFNQQPRSTTLRVAGLSIDYDLAGVAIHSATSQIFDVNRGATDGGFNEFANRQGGVGVLYNFPLFWGSTRYISKRQGISEELRFASTGSPKPFSWVGGLFYSYQKTHSESQDYTNLNTLAPVLTGVSDTLLFGAPVEPDGGISYRNQFLKERELAAFGEVNYYPLERLKVILGGRVSRNTFSYDSYLRGSFFGYSVPTTANGGLSGGEQKATSFSPKLGLQYELNDHDNVYLTAAKGFRVGGINTGAPAFKCAGTFATLGITGTPSEYDPDSLWSYEVGAKVRALGGRAQLNASAFYIDWSNVQVNYTLPNPCGFSYVTNAGGAVSKGLDFQGQVQIVRGLTASLQAAYTDAEYTSALVGPAPTSSIFIRKGDKLPTPPWSYTVGARYDFDLLGSRAYLRGDYQYASKYKRGFGPGSSSYNVDTYEAEATHLASVRAGARVAQVDVSVFANNLFNSRDILSKSGGRSCGNADCSVVRSNNPFFNNLTFRPRTVGVTLSYRR